MSTPVIVVPVLDNDTDKCYADCVIHGAKIRQRREELGLSQAELAERVGTRQQTIGKIEKGDVEFSRYTEKINEVLGIKNDVQVVIPPAETNARTVPLVGARDFPVHASAECGDGGVILSSDPVDYIERPAPLAHVRDAYGILVAGESMVPAYEPGDTVWVHPHLPPQRDCDVVLYGKDANDNDVATIKRLTRITEENWHLRQWNPPAGRKPEFTLPRRGWPRCHRIIGKYNRR